MTSTASMHLLCVCVGLCHNGIATCPSSRIKDQTRKQEQQRLSSSTKSHSQRKKLCKFCKKHLLSGDAVVAERGMKQTNPEVSQDN